MRRTILTSAFFALLFAAVSFAVPSMPSAPPSNGMDMSITSCWDCGTGQDLAASAMLGAIIGLLTSPVIWQRQDDWRAARVLAEIARY